jgi:CRP-like cAMP-binding protein
VLCREGQPAHQFFVVVEGEARVTKGGEHVRTLGPGDFFGDLALLDRAPRNATVTALTRMRVLEITKEPIEALLRRSPELLQRFSHVLAKREQERAQIAQRTIQVATVENDLMARMRSFFRSVLWSETAKPS